MNSLAVLLYQIYEIKKLLGNEEIKAYSLEITEKELIIIGVRDKKYQYLKIEKDKITDFVLSLRPKQQKALLNLLFHIDNAIKRISTEEDIESIRVDSKNREITIKFKE